MISFSFLSNTWGINQESSVNGQIQSLPTMFIYALFIVKLFGTLGGNIFEPETTCVFKFLFCSNFVKRTLVDVFASLFDFYQLLAKSFFDKPDTQ